MGLWADDPLTRRLVAAIGLAVALPHQTASSAPVTPSPGRRVVPASSGTLFAGFTEAARPNVGPIGEARQAISGAQKSYSIYDKGSQLLDLANLTPGLETVATESVDISTAAAFTDFGGELGVSAGAGGGGGAGGGASVGVAATTASATGGAPAAGAVAAGTAAGETVGLLGILGPAGILAGVTVAVATGVHMLIKAILPRDLPFGRGQSFSAADNLASQQSKLLGIRGADAMIGYIKSHPNFRDLIRLANSGPNLSPHGEVLFHHPVAGLGATFYNNASPDYSALLANVWNGDVQALDEFVRGVEIYTGETGATHPHWEATDWYRRSLVHSVPVAIQAQLAPLETIWQPDPGYATQGAALEAYLYPGGVADANAVNVVNAAGSIDAYLAVRKKDPYPGCPYFRDLTDPRYRITDEDIARIRSHWPYTGQVFYNIDSGQYENYRLGTVVYPDPYSYQQAIAALGQSQGGE